MIFLKIIVSTILFWRESAYVGQTIIGLSALTEIATFAYNLLKGQKILLSNVSLITGWMTTFSIVIVSVRSELSN